MDGIFTKEDARHRHSVLGTAVLARLREMNKTQVDLANYITSKGYPIRAKTVGDILFGISAVKRDDELRIICEYVGFQYAARKRAGRG